MPRAENVGTFRSWYETELRMHNGAGTGIKSDPERVHPNIFECTNLSPAAYLRLRILICSNLKVYLSKSKMYFTKSKMYLSKKLIYLSELQNVFV